MIHLYKWIIYSTFNGFSVIPDSHYFHPTAVQVQLYMLRAIDNRPVKAMEQPLVASLQEKKKTEGSNKNTESRERKKIPNSSKPN